MASQSDGNLRIKGWSGQKFHTIAWKLPEPSTDKFCSTSLKTCLGKLPHWGLPDPDIHLIGYSTQPIGQSPAPKIHEILVIAIWPRKNDLEKWRVSWGDQWPSRRLTSACIDCLNLPALLPHRSFPAFPNRSPFAPSSLPAIWISQEVRGGW